MRQYPTLDEEREQGLAALVREVAGDGANYDVVGPQIATFALGALWARGGGGSQKQAAVATLTALSVATDALKSARLSLYAGDYGGMWVQIRRGHEMLTFALAVNLSPTEADRWLAGGELKQSELRIIIEKKLPKTAVGLRKAYADLSDGAHGKAYAAVTVYEDHLGRFSWPVERADVSRAHVWAAHVFYCAFTVALLGTLRWLGGNGWTFLDSDLQPRAERYYDALTGYMASATTKDEWQALAPGEVRDWLMEAFGASWEERERRGGESSSD